MALQVPQLSNALFLDGGVHYSSLADKWHVATAGAVVEGGALGGNALAFLGANAPGDGKYVGINLQHLKRRNVLLRAHIKCAKFTGAPMVELRDNAGNLWISFGIMPGGGLFTVDALGQTRFAATPGFISTNGWHQFEVGFSYHSADGMFWFASVDNRQISGYSLYTAGSFVDPIIKYVRLGPAGDDCYYSDIIIHSGMINKHAMIATASMENPDISLESSCDSVLLTLEENAPIDPIRMQAFGTVQVSCAGGPTAMGGFHFAGCEIDGDSNHLPHTVGGYNATQVCHLHPWIRYMWTPESLRQCGSFCVTYRAVPVEAP